MDYSNQQPLFSKRNIFIFVVLLLLMVSVPIAVFLLRQDQATQLSSKAAEETMDKIKFKGDKVREDASTGRWITTDPTITLELKAPNDPPFGPPKK